MDAYLRVFYNYQGKDWSKEERTIPWRQGK